MAPFRISGWKDVLRPIRDGLRDRFPPSGPKEDLEERRKRQARDAARGFAYFEDFDQLLSWKPEDADPIQLANTPLLTRSTRPVAKGKSGPSSKLMLIHDYAGNYHEYEAAQGAAVDAESYTCGYLQFVDTFVYFSHKLVCVPPSTWVNSCHRNGVQVLGTFLVEPGSLDVDHILCKTTKENGEVSYIVAQQLIAIADLFGFDGWLVNIEKAFSRRSWDLLGLCKLLEELRDGLGEGKQLVWYDALTTDNQVIFQNTLNEHNLVFAQACGSILTNYCWEEDGARAATRMAHKGQIPLENIYFGIDVWAQNAQQGPHKRVTYPTEGGGGTNTGIAVAKLAELGLSAGVFGPAWSFEHCAGHGKIVETAVWEGADLPTDIGCHCGPSMPHHTSDYKLNPLVRCAKETPAGSGTFLYTNFERGFSCNPYEEGKEGKFGACVGAQSVVPRSVTTNTLLDLCPPSSDGSAALVSELMLDGCTGFAISLDTSMFRNQQRRAPLDAYYHLYNLDMFANGSLGVDIEFSCPIASVINWSGNFQLSYSNGKRQRQDFHLENRSLKCDVISIDSRTNERDTVSANDRLVGLGVQFRIDAEDLHNVPLSLINIYNIRIRPNCVYDRSVLGIQDVRIRERGEGDTHHHRLSWSCKDVDANHAQFRGLPYSRTTGPFAYFTINLWDGDGEESKYTGRAYACEFKLPQHVVERMQDDYESSLVSVTGVTFDGECWQSDQLGWADVEWDMIEKDDRIEGFEMSDR